MSNMYHFYNLKDSYCKILFLKILTFLDFLPSLSTYLQSLLFLKCAREPIFVSCLTYRVEYCFTFTCSLDLKPVRSASVAGLRRKGRFPIGHPEAAFYFWVSSIIS